MESGAVDTFIIEDENGKTYKAEIVTMLGIEDREYLIYSIPNELNQETVTICASRIVKDEKGQDKLIDLDIEEDKEKIRNFIKEISKE